VNVDIQFRQPSATIGPEQVQQSQPIRSPHRRGRAASLKGGCNVPYVEAISKVGSCFTLNDTERAIKTFLGGGIGQAARDVLIRAGRELGVRPQRDAFELPSAVRLLDLHAEGVVAVCYDHDTGVGAKVQVPELMTGGKCSNEQLRRIPSRRIAAEYRVGRAGYGCFALCADLVRE
jgi:hypothetical protein